MKNVRFLNCMLHTYQQTTTKIIFGQTWTVVFSCSRINVTFCCSHHIAMCSKHVNMAGVVINRVLYLKVKSLWQMYVIITY